MATKNVAFIPNESEIRRLIQKARKHPLGLDFLKRGHLMTVAVTLKAHVFTVEAAREKMSREKASLKKSKTSRSLTL